MSPDVEASQSGLHEINMTRLGQFVALTGKNGAGKSRLLSILVGYTRTRIKHLPNLPSIRRNIADLANGIEQHPTDQRSQQWKTPLKEYQQSLEQTTNRVIAPLDRSFSILQFVPKQLNLQDPRNLKKAELLGFSEKTRQPGVVGIEQGCLAYIQSVQAKFYEATHPQTNIREDRQGEIAEDYKALRELVSNLLKSQITRTEDGNATVFGN
ncbi:MAG: ATP-binding cassette domain-containing protein [Burkholderiales bacterium]